MPFKSCVDSDDYDFDKLSEKVQWQPNFVAPVGYGEFTLEYLLDQHEEEGVDKTIYFEKDGSIHIKYMEKDIFSYDVNDVLRFPEQSTIPLTFNLPQVFGGGLPFASLPAIPKQEKFVSISASPATIKLSEADLNTNIQFRFSNPLNAPIDVSVNLLDGKNAGIDVDETFRVPADATAHTENLDLSSLNVRFLKPYTTANEIRISFGVSIVNNASGIISGSGDMGISLVFQNIVFQLAKGDFGNQTIDIGSGDIDLGVDFWDDIDGNFTFEDPKINLKFKNKVGVPIQIDANMTATDSDGNTESLNPDPNNVEVTRPNYPKTEADVYAGIDVLIPYNKANSNIVDLMALPPSGNITYTGRIMINPIDGEGNRYEPLDLDSDEDVDLNIISGTSSISADLEMDIPMDFKADNLSISDTIDDVNIDDAEKMIKAAIIITSENGLPLDVKIENIFFTDAAYTVLSTITDKSIIKAAGVTATGEVDASTITKEDFTIELTEDQIKSLNDTENIIIKAAVSTTNEGATSVKLKGTDKLKFSIAVNAQLDLSK